MRPALIFAFTYVAFSIGRVPGLRSDRMAAAVVGAVLLVAMGSLSMSEAQASVDGATLGLLFGMMVLSAALDVSGAFSLLGFWVTRSARRPIALLAAISVASALLSAFLINDVVCIAFTPLVLQIADELERDARPYLLALATSSNIGSAATITGNSQNILIGSLSHIKSVVPRLEHADKAWLTLAMASTLAGNLTLPGSLATIIVIERAKGRARISFFDFLRVGLPTGVVSLVAGAAWLTWGVR